MTTAPGSERRRASPVPHLPAPSTWTTPSPPSLSRPEGWGAPAPHSRGRTFFYHQEDISACPSHIARKGDTTLRGRPPAAPQPLGRPMFSCLAWVRVSLSVPLVPPTCTSVSLPTPHRGHLTEGPAAAPQRRKAHSGLTPTLTLQLHPSSGPFTTASRPVTGHSPMCTSLGPGREGHSRPGEACSLGR